MAIDSPDPWFASVAFTAQALVTLATTFGNPPPTPKCLSFRRDHIITCQGAAKGGPAKGLRSLVIVIGNLLVTYSDAAVTLFDTFLPNSFCRTPFAAG